MIQFLFGLAVGWASIGAVWLARRSWHQNVHDPTPPPPRSEAQRQNEAVTHELWATTPVVHSARVARRIRRGRGRPGQEELYRDSL